MARLHTGGKVSRVMALLMGLRQRRAASTLAYHGFTQQDLDLGWKLLRKMVGEKLEASPQETPVDPTALADLDRWENMWFPIADATLAHNHPEVYRRVFRNLAQTVGTEVIVSVGTFVGRLKELEKGDEQARAARRLLDKRGLTAQVIQQAEGLLKQLRTVQTAGEVDIEERRQAQAEAEGAMWAWYLEWSTIARTAISDGRLLRSLGFGRNGRRGVAADDDDGNDGNEGNDVDLPPAGPATPGTPGNS